jgi:hypothetical protein
MKVNDSKSYAHFSRFFYLSLNVCYSSVLVCVYARQYADTPWVGVSGGAVVETL